MDVARVRSLPPGIWTGLAWCAGSAYSLTRGIRLPGEARPFRALSYDHLSATHWAFVLAAAVLALAGAVLLRRRPLIALSLLLAGSAFTAMALTSTEITFAQFLAAEVALAHIAATRPQRTALAAASLAVGTLTGYAAVRLLLGFPIGTSAELIVALTAVIAWLAGTWLRQSRDGARARHAQAVTAERLRIARELHDSVAHSMGIIAIQAGAAKLVIDTRPAGAREALGAIETASRETLASLRHMLGALRRAEPVTAAPAPGLADLDRLAAAAAAAGVRVDLTWRGPRCPLPAEIDRSAYRIVQEAVTNVMRHSGGGRCRVSIEHARDGLAIEVVDPGPGPRRPGAGYGIAGMRERVGLLDGDFTAGPRPGGGFRVAARLPVGAP
ncbi:sensor histidine kinase [Spirillospora sp. NPDC052242]